MKFYLMICTALFISNIIIEEEKHKKFVAIQNLKEFKSELDNLRKIDSKEYEEIKIFIKIKDTFFGRLILSFLCSYTPLINIFSLISVLNYSR